MSFSNQVLPEPGSSVLGLSPCFLEAYIDHNQLSSEANGYNNPEMIRSRHLFPATSAHSITTQRQLSETQCNISPMATYPMYLNLERGNACMISGNTATQTVLKPAIQSVPIKQLYAMPIYHDAMTASPIAVMPVLQNREMLVINQQRAAAAKNQYKVVSTTQPHSDAKLLSLQPSAVGGTNSQLQVVRNTSASQEGDLGTSYNCIDNECAQGVPKETSCYIQAMLLCQAQSQNPSRKTAKSIDKTPKDQSLCLTDSTNVKHSSACNGSMAKALPSWLKLSESANLYLQDKHDDDIPAALLAQITRAYVECSQLVMESPRVNVVMWKIYDELSAIFHRFVEHKQRISSSDYKEQNEHSVQRPLKVHIKTQTDNSLSDHLFKVTDGHDILVSRPMEYVLSMSRVPNKKTGRKADTSNAAASKQKTKPAPTNAAAKKAGKKSPNKMSKIKVSDSGEEANASKDKNTSADSKAMTDCQLDNQFACCFDCCCQTPEQLATPTANDLQCYIKNQQPTEDVVDFVAPVPTACCQSSMPMPCYTQAYGTPVPAPQCAAQSQLPSIQDVVPANYNKYCTQGCICGGMRNNMEMPPIAPAHSMAANECNCCSCFMPPQLNQTPNPGTALEANLSPTPIEQEILNTMARLTQCLETLAAASAAQAMNAPPSMQNPTCECSECKRVVTIHNSGNDISVTTPYMLNTPRPYTATDAQFSNQVVNQQQSTTGTRLNGSDVGNFAKTDTPANENQDSLGCDPTCPWRAAQNEFIAQLPKSAEKVNELSQRNLNQPSGTIQPIQMTASKDSAHKGSSSSSSKISLKNSQSAQNRNDIQSQTNAENRSQNVPNVPIMQNLPTAQNPQIASSLQNTQAAATAQNLMPPSQFQQTLNNQQQPQQIYAAQFNTNCNCSARASPPYAEASYQNHNSAFSYMEYLQKINQLGANEQEMNDLSQANQYQPNVSYFPSSVCPIHGNYNIRENCGNWDMGYFC